MRDAGTGVHFAHEVVHLVIGHLGRAEGGDESQLVGLEVGTQAADDAPLAQAAHALQGLLLRDAQQRAQVGIGAGRQGKGRLDDVQQACLLYTSYAVSMAVMKGERSGEHEEKGRRNDMAGRCCNGAGGSPQWQSLSIW